MSSMDGRGDVIPGTEIHRIIRSYLLPCFLGYKLKLKLSQKANAVYRERGKLRVIASNSTSRLEYSGKEGNIWSWYLMSIELAVHSEVL